MAVAFDEMNGPDGDVRPAYQELSRWLKETPPDALEYRRQEAELLFRRIGITFAVYGDAEAQERLIPFDVIPRIGGELGNVQIFATGAPTQAMAVPGVLGQYRAFERKPESFFV